MVDIWSPEFCDIGEGSGSEIIGRVAIAEAVEVRSPILDVEEGVSEFEGGVVFGFV